jgi:hypothetical protein
MSPWLSVVIPTIGRPTLHQTLDSIDAQPESGEVEVLVVADTHGGFTGGLLEVQARIDRERDHDRYVWLEVDGGQHCWGQPQRTAGARLASAEWVWFSQDDNIAAAGAFAAIQRVVDHLDRPRPLFFRWLSPWRELIWRDQHLVLGNIDADCIVLPKRIAAQIEWGLRYEGDFDAAVAAVHLAGDELVWCESLVSIAHPGMADRWWEEQAA